MRALALPAVALLALLVTAPAFAAERDVAAYLGGAGDQRLLAVLPLSDGTLLLGGSATLLDFLPAGTKTIELATDALPPETPGSTPIILHVSGDLQNLLHVVTLPGLGGDVRHIRTNAAPGQTTGDIYLSGTRADGYFLAKLSGNFVAAPPTAVAWAHAVRAKGTIQNTQPWDVGGDGKVVFGTGEGHSTSWCAVERLTAAGQRDVVPQWRTHWFKTDDGSNGGEHYGPAADAPRPLSHSAIVLKVWGRGDFRSWTREDYLHESPDGNGGVKVGRWPFDAMFDGHFDPATKETAKVRDDGRGYFGYRWGRNPCAIVSAITVDRRTNVMVIGGCNQSRLPDGNPDFEPWVVVMEPDGVLRWWQRLYPEAKGVSTPDQYVDALAIDDRTDAPGGPVVVVGARCHGNNVNNFWQGDAVTDPANPGRSVQKQFTGKSGNIHISWLGRLSLADGTLRHASYLAEYGEGAKTGGDAFADPLLSHWPAFTSGWPDVNTTRIEPGALRVDDRGGVYVLAVGRRVVTTSNAFMEMPSPRRDAGKVGQWADFVRVYPPDLTTMWYSSILAGKWDWDSGTGGSNVDLVAVAPVPGGVVIVGHSGVDKKTGEVTGDDMPTANVPAWAQATRQGRMGVVALLHFDRPQ